MLSPAHTHAHAPTATAELSDLTCSRCRYVRRPGVFRQRLSSRGLDPDGSQGRGVRPVHGGFNESR